MLHIIYEDGLRIMTKKIRIPFGSNNKKKLEKVEREEENEVEMRRNRKHMYEYYITTLTIVPSYSV